MAGSYGKVTLLANLGRDPISRTTQTGKKVVEFSVATNERQGRDAPEITTWWRVTAWERLADVCEQYLSKGSYVYIEGTPSLREYEKDGVTRQSLEVRAREIRLLDRRVQGDGGAGRNPSAPAGGGDDLFGDIPF